MSACTTASKHNLPNCSVFFKITLAISDEWLLSGHVSFLVSMNTVGINCITELACRTSVMFPMV